MSSQVTCLVCGQYSGHALMEHLERQHDSMTPLQYLQKYPTAELVSQPALDLFYKKAPTPVGPSDPKDAKIKFAGFDLEFNWDIDPRHCLPMPDNYVTPRHGKLARKFQMAVISLFKKRSMYIHGLPGAGKDALFHAFSYITRTPAIIRSIRPGTNINSWFFSRSFSDKGTFWEEGPMLQALRDGYTTESGRKVPFLALISDFDRADRSQAEALRLIIDSIEGRVEGPKGDVYPVLKGTIVVATGNSAGAGDVRGRCISSNVIDASILDRFQRKYEFPWMDWKDEEVVCKRKFPILVEKMPKALTEVGKCVKAIRQDILNEEIYAEFSHRAVCAWLQNAEDIIEVTGKVPKNLLKTSAQCWLDGMPDEENRLRCRKLMDPHLTDGALDEGATDHIKDGELVGDL